MSNKILGPLTEAWLAANDSNSNDLWKAMGRLGAALRASGYKDLVSRHFEHWDHFAKWQLVVTSVLINYDFKQIDDGIWHNRKEGLKLSHAEIDEEIRQAHCVAALYTSQQD